MKKLLITALFILLSVIAFTGQNNSADAKKRPTPTPKPSSAPTPTHSASGSAQFN